MPAIALSKNILGRDTAISKTITALRWPLAALVILDHYFRLQLIDGSLASSLNDSQTISTIEAFIISFLKNYPVPVFFFISGYLLYLGDSPRANYVMKLKKLPRGILLPYIFWIVFALLESLISGLSQGESLKTALQIPDGGRYMPGIMKWLITSFVGLPWPANLPLWYVRDLALIILVSPVLHISLKFSKGWLVVLLGILFVTSNSDNLGIRLSTGLFFFSAGYWLRYTGCDILRLSKSLFIPAITIYIAGASYYFLDYDITVDNSTGMPWINCLMKNLAVISFLPIAFHLVSRAVASGWVKASPFLASASFFIYVTHYPIKHTIIHLSEMLSGGGGTNGLLTLTLASVATPLILTAIYFMLKKQFPTFMRIIDGR